jgi:hypothetical protein
MPKTQLRYFDRDYGWTVFVNNRPTDFSVQCGTGCTVICTERGQRIVAVCDSLRDARKKLASIFSTSAVTMAARSALVLERVP